MKTKIILFLCFSVCAKVFSQQQLPLLKELTSAVTGQSVVSELVVQSSGQQIIAVKSGKTMVYNLVQGDKYALENKIINSHVACTFDFGAFVVVGNSMYDFVVRATKDGAKQYVLNNSKGDARSVAINPVNDDVIVGYSNGDLRRWMSNGRRVDALSSSFSSPIMKIAVSDDGKFIVAVDESGKIEILKSGETRIVEGMFLDIVGLYVASEKNRILAVSKNGLVYSWDLEGKNASSVKLSVKFISSAICSHDLAYIFIGTEMGKLLVYDLVNQRERNQFAAHSDNITGLSISNDGRILASLSSDEGLFVWSTSDLSIAPRAEIVRQGKPQLVVGDLSVIDANGNGKVEKGEKVSLQLQLSNKGNYQTDSIVFDLDLHAELTGLKANKPSSLSSLQAKSDYTVLIPINTDNLGVGMYDVNVSVSEISVGNVKRNVLVSCENNTGNYLMVKDYWFESPSNKVEKNIPLSLKVQVYNPSIMPISNAVMQFKLPNGVMPMNRLEESFSLKAGESAVIMTQLLLSKEVSDTVFSVAMSVSGVNYSNIADVRAVCKLNDVLKPRAIVNVPESVEVPSNTNDMGVNVELGDSTLVSHDSLTYRGDPLASIDLSTAKKEMEIGNYYALIIGVDSYKSPWSPLKNAVHDAQSIENVLRSKYRFDHFKVLYNDKATRSNVIAELEWLVANVKQKDNVFIYYSGHGDYKKDLNKGFWVPSDATSSSTSNFISNSDIQTYLGGIKSKHTLLVSDACFSGDIFRGTTETVKFENSDKYYKKVYELPSRQAISSGGIEPVLDGGSDGHSIFAYYLLKVLQNNNGKYLDASQLYSKIKIPVVNNSEQDPKFAPIKNTGDEGGQFLFIKK